MHHLTISHLFMVREPLDPGCSTCDVGRWGPCCCCACYASGWAMRRWRPRTPPRSGGDRSSTSSASAKLPVYIDSALRQKSLTEVEPFYQGERLRVLLCFLPARLRRNQGHHRAFGLGTNAVDAGLLLVAAHFALLTKYTRLASGELFHDGDLFGNYHLCHRRMADRRLSES